MIKNSLWKYIFSKSAFIDKQNKRSFDFVQKSLTHYEGNNIVNQVFCPQNISSIWITSTI